MTPNTFLNKSAANMSHAAPMSHVAQFTCTANDNVYITQQQQQQQQHQQQQQQQQPFQHQHPLQLQQFLTHYHSFVAALPSSSSTTAATATATLLSQLLMTQSSAVPSTLASLDTIQYKEQQRSRHLQWQHEQQKAYVNALVDVTVQVIASIWPNSVAVQTNGDNSTRIADLNTFLHHLLKHSRTTHSTLQLAIFYLFRIRSRILSLFHPPQNNNNNSSTDVQQDVYMTCGRRMFLAALISAHKFLQDKTYKNSAWSKVSGLNVKEINHAEKVFLQLLDYRLMVKKEVYDQWMTMLQALLTKQRKPSPSVVHPTRTCTVSLPIVDANHAAAVITDKSPMAHVPRSTSSLTAVALPSPPMEEVDTHAAATAAAAAAASTLLRSQQAQQCLPSPPWEEMGRSGISRKRASPPTHFDNERWMKRHCR